MFESSVLLISISGACVCPVCLYKIPNLILNVFIRVYVKVWPGVRRKEKSRQEKQSEGVV